MDSAIEKHTGTRLLNFFKSGFLFIDLYQNPSPHWVHFVQWSSLTTELNINWTNCLNSRALSTLMNVEKQAEWVHLFWKWLRHMSIIKPEVSMTHVRVHTHKLIHNHHSTVFGNEPKMPAMSSTHVSAIYCIAAVVHSQHNCTSKVSKKKSYCISWAREMQPLLSSTHLQYIAYPVVSARSSSQIQGRQLETPLSTVDSSEKVGPKAARTLGSVRLGYKAPSVFILHLYSLSHEPYDLNLNCMSQLTGIDKWMQSSNLCRVG